MMWILQKLLRQLQYSSILHIQVVTLRIIGGCFGNDFLKAIYSRLYVLYVYV